MVWLSGRIQPRTPSALLLFHCALSVKDAIRRRSGPEFRVFFNGDPRGIRNALRAGMGRTSPPVGSPRNARCDLGAGRAHAESAHPFSPGCCRPPRAKPATAFSIHRTVPVVGRMSFPGRKYSTRNCALRTYSSRWECPELAVSRSPDTRHRMTVLGRFEPVLVVPLWSIE